jgi:chemotaxis protein CheX
VVEIAADIEDITQTIWSTMFDLPLEAAGPAVLGSEPVLTGCVQIVGGWNGAVMLQCPMSLASTLTEQMFQAGTVPTLEEIRDALGELTNVLGGNLKATLPGPSHISLPTVAIGSDYELGVIDASSVTAVSFSCDGHPLRVTLFEGSNAADDADA